MKFIVFISFLFFACTVSAQQWRVEFREGNKLYEEGKYQEAYDHFISAQQQAPENIDLSREISRTAYRKGEFKEAEQNFHNQLQDAKSAEEKAALYHNMGNCNMKDKNYVEAIESYKNALRLNPKAQETRYNLAEAKRRLQQEQKQEQQKEQQDQQEQENQQNQENKDQQNENQQNQNQQKQNQQGQQQNQQQKGDGQAEQNQNKSNSSSANSSAQQGDKLSNKKTERLLDELMKQEMETKRKLRGMGSEGREEKVKSGKRW